MRDWLMTQFEIPPISIVCRTELEYLSDRLYSLAVSSLTLFSHPGPSVGC
jgi:hypothetical protein